MRALTDEQIFAELRRAPPHGPEYDELFREVERRHRGLVRGVARRILLRFPDEAEDAAQEAWRRFHKKANRGEGVGFLRAVAKTAALDHLRKVKRESGWALDPNVKGSVSDSMGAPLADVRVEARSVDDLPMSPTRTTSSKRGTYILRGLLPGSYVLTFAFTGMASVVTQVLVQAAKVITVNVRMTADVSTEAVRMNARDSRSVREPQANECWEDSQTAPEEDSAKALVRKHLIALLIDCMEGLSWKAATAIRLALEDGLNQDQVAAELGVTARTVRNWRSRDFRSLRLCMEDKGVANLNGVFDVR